MFLTFAYDFEFYIYIYMFCFYVVYPYIPYYIFADISRAYDYCVEKKKLW